MRKSTLLILGIICPAIAYVADTNLKTITLEGKTAYMLEAGAYPHESSALQFKFKLASQFQQPVSISYLNDRHLYLVTMGPIDDFEKAKTIEKELNSTVAMQSFPLQSPRIQTVQLEGPTQSQTDSQFETMSPNPNPNLPPTQNGPPKDELPNSEILTQVEATVPNNEKKLWNLRNAEIRAVIGEVSRVTGKNFVIDPRVQGKISIISSTPISDKELYQVFLSMLQVSGYAAVPFGEVIKVVPNIDAKTISNYIPRPHFASLKGDEMLVEVIPVQYVPAEQLVPVLRPLMPQWSSVSAYEPSNMLILSGRANNIKRLANIIKQVDSSTSNGIDIVPLRHALAMDVAATLKDLVKTPVGPAGGGRQAMMAADDRSNSILLSGSRTDRIRLRVLIEKLDKRSLDGANSSTQVVYLHYLRAEDLVSILAGVAQANFSGNVGTTIGTITRPALDSTNPASSIVGDTSSGSGTGPTSALSAPSSSGVSSTVNVDASPNTSAVATKNESSTKPSVQIIAEPNTNSIILNAPPSIIRILRAVIAQLDFRPAQLLIEALVTEVNENDVKDLGIEWGTQYNNLPFQNGFAIISTKLSVSDFQARIRSLVEQQKANVLSTPSVMVLDNRQAKILVGKQVSVGTTTYPNNAGGTTTASPYTTFSRVNVALHLYVRPQITAGQGIQMQIDQGNDTIDPLSSINNTTNPVFKVSSIVTSVQVESGDIVVLGGLQQNSLGNNDNRLGILGDIPGIGRLFQHNLRTREKRVLMVFIRPVILKTEHDSVSLSGAKYDNLRRYQLDWMRTQEFDPRDREVVMPSLNEAPLPRPFMPPPGPTPPLDGPVAAVTPVEPLQIPLPLDPRPHADPRMPEK